MKAIDFTFNSKYLYMELMVEMEQNYFDEFSRATFSFWVTMCQSIEWEMVMGYFAFCLSVHNTVHKW